MSEVTVEIQQITFGPQHHFFGYIGHAQTIPWNRSGRYIVMLRAAFQDHMPKPDERADIVLLDTRANYAVRVVDGTRAWNFQQGTMLYWNPQAPETQFFFNDRDPRDNKVFCVLFDISRGPKGGRVKEFRYAEAPFGCSGVAQRGGYFLGLNYGRLARLRPVTGYPGAHDWTGGAPHPEDDGIWNVDVATGAKRLIVSYRQIADALRPAHPEVDRQPLFINHTLWNRDDDRIYFYARAEFDTPRRIDVPFTVAPDGTALTRQTVHIGGHPEWELGHRMIGRAGDDQVLYDTDRQAVVGKIGDPKTLPRPGGDIALSPDARWFCNGYSDEGKNYYVILRRSDSAAVRSYGFDQNGLVSGDLRIDAAPCWNRESTEILFPAIAADPARTRQTFLMRIRP